MALPELTSGPVDRSGKLSPFNHKGFLQCILIMPAGEKNLSDRRLVNGQLTIRLWTQT